MSKTITLDRLLAMPDREAARYNLESIVFRSEQKNEDAKEEPEPTVTIPPEPPESVVTPRSVTPPPPPPTETEKQVTLHAAGLILPEMRVREWKSTADFVHAVCNNSPRDQDDAVSTLFWSSFSGAENAGDALEKVIEVCRQQRVKFCPATILPPLFIVNQFGGRAGQIVIHIKTKREYLIVMLENGAIVPVASGTEPVSAETAFLGGLYGIRQTESETEFFRQVAGLYSASLK